MAMSIEDAKAKLDAHIKKQRTHMYKPIQIAEILYAYRTRKDDIDPLDLNTYRTKSRRWRDEVTKRLVGRVSTSSARFQDNLFESNAIPPTVLSVLAEENNNKNGVVESYIYHRFKQRLNLIMNVYNYLQKCNKNTFDLQYFISLFENQEELKKSIDKIYEITVYSLFYTIIRQLGVEVELKITNTNEELLKDFSHFTKMVLGIDHNSLSKVVKANVYRVGVTNAADRGLDMWSNFGPAIQVKHLSLTEEVSEEIAGSIDADQIVIVCKACEAGVIESILNQLGWSNRIQGIVTETNLIEWYRLCLTKYGEEMGDYLLDNLNREFVEEFPHTFEIEKFMNERGYSEGQLVGLWKL